MWDSVGLGLISFYFKKIQLSAQGLSVRLNMKHGVPFGSITLKGAISSDFKALLGLLLSGGMWVALRGGRPGFSYCCLLFPVTAKVGDRLSPGRSP